ncbi:hypothetical protein BDN67DRAFT_985059 [Paxillus ammoniavirescens]|nr:hypothetical protein BDN67DRAFT_985059 [Paxillus ammoniavirescens]
MSDSTIESASEDESPAIEWAPTSKEEDMPPVMEEEEGEEDEREDEKEEADIYFIAESCQKEEWDEVENTAAKWNLDRGPLNEVKARMRVVIMAGWKQEDGNTVTAIGDFNDEIVDGEKFQGVQKMSVAWDKYIGTHFEPEGEPNTDDADSEEESNPKQKQKRERADPTTQVTHEDGTIWIGDLVGTEVACACPKAVAPFKKLPQFIDEMVASEHLPPDFQLSSDPSHMKTSEALQFLEFIQARQKEHPDDIFKFHHWIDENGDLQESMEDEDDTKRQNKDSIEAPSSTSCTGQPTRGKGKGKEKDKGKVPAENAGGAWDIGNMQPSTQVTTKNAGRPQLYQKGTVKPKAPAPSRQAIQSTAAMEISVTSQPTKMPKDKRTSKKVNPVMVPVLGSEQESDSANNKKFNYPSQ